MPEKTPLNNLYAALKTNRIITITALVFSSISIILSLAFAYYTYSFSINHVLFLNYDGKIIPAELIERNKVISIEIKRHLDLWFRSYYTYDQNNLQQQREAGLWLIDSADGARLEEHYSQSWFKQVVQKNISQTTELIPESVSITGNKEPYQFKASALIKIRRENSAEYNAYRLDVSGQIITVSPNYPINPNGLLILNYVEQPLVKLNP